MVTGVSTSAVSSFLSGSSVRGAQGAEEAREGAKDNPAEEKQEVSASQGAQKAVNAQAAASGIGTNVNISA